MPRLCVAMRPLPTAADWGVASYTDEDYRFLALAVRRRWVSGGGPLDALFCVRRFNPMLTFRTDDDRLRPHR
ncbi:hypothetical protein AB852_24715 [Streptomyces uncialis]|uniref:Uncharacterized protein n=1 Tax=Streptomyces uncialis TaxID=1048205 RepID=A0A1Q4V2U9_9ACTN|nr:hypothetical protein AB852_24715 [Streptomyces uncialis]